MSSSNGPWFRVPEDLALKDEKEQLAWVLVLGRWHQGKPAPHSDLRALTGWGAGKVVAFVKAAREWTQKNGGVGPEQERSKSGAKAEQPVKVEAPQKEKSGVKAEQNRSESGVSAPKNQPPTPPPAPLKTEIEIKNCLTPPTPSPGSGSPPAQEGGQASESLIFLGSADREALAKHGIKTVSGLKAAHKRQPLRYLKGVGEARANRIFGLLAEKFPSDPELSALSQAAPTSPANAEAGFDEIANNFWKSKETPNAIANA